MAGLFLLRDDSPLGDARLADAQAQFAGHGFAAPHEARAGGWRLLHFRSIVGGPDTLLSRGDDLVAVAGTITVDGLVGRPALERLLTMPLPAIDWARIGGHFVAVVRRQGRAFVFADFFAAFQLFHDVALDLMSTSLLGALAALPRVRFDPQGVYEYAFNVVPVGNDTVFAELKTLGPGRVIELAATGAILHEVPVALPRAERNVPLATRIARQRTLLSAAIAEQVGHFADRIHCPLSGGLDSRLVLAGLRAAGSRPDVYVYGPAGSEDVAIARAIGRALDFPVMWIDKAASRHVAPDEFAEQTARNFREFDALPTYGNIFDNGANAAARDARHAGGGLAVSGGCGEIYRNFFYLPDRAMTAHDVAATFFARYTLGDVSTAFDARAFLDRLAEKIGAAVGIDRGPIPRDIVEHIYPRIRCRALFGREISLEARYGSYFMPFLDHRIVADAMTLPIGLKHAGRFEAALLAAIDPALAAQPSAYGHDFAGPPGWRHRFGEWQSRMRPIWLRRRSYALQRRLRPMGDEHGGLLSPDYMGRVIDPELPAMRRFFQVDRITDSGLWRRLAALEYLAQQLGAKLA